MLDRIIDAMTARDEWLKVDSIDLEGQGVARNAEGKVVFIEGALPGEEAQVKVGRSKSAWEQGEMTAMRRESALRVRPGCPHFGLHPGACGGCKMQHLDASAQVAVKQRVLEDNLQHLAKVKPERMLRAIEGPIWGRLSRWSMRPIRARSGSSIWLTRCGSTGQTCMSAR